jgi:hypothetical protein
LSICEPRIIQVSGGRDVDQDRRGAGVRSVARAAVPRESGESARGERGAGHRAACRRVVAFQRRRVRGAPTESGIRPLARPACGPRDREGSCSPLGPGRLPRKRRRRPESSPCGMLTALGMCPAAYSSRVRTSRMSGALPAWIRSARSAAPIGCGWPARRGFPQEVATSVSAARSAQAVRVMRRRSTRFRPPDQRMTGSLKRISAVSGQRVSAGTKRFGQ